MYIVEITNGEVSTVIHGMNVNLQSGKISKSINAIDTFSFSMFPNNAGFALIKEFTTLVKVYNTSKGVYDFIGRVLYSEIKMDESGLITKNVTCESVLAYLCDSQQEYADPQNWTVSGLLNHLIDCHNSQVEAYKRITVGKITVTDKNDNLYIGVQRENTWEAIASKLIEILGGELQCRVEDDTIYLDYLEQIGEAKETPIALSKNMKAITREQDPTSYVTRLIPLGCKLTKTVEETDDEGNITTETVETEERLDISSVNNGLKYIDDEAAIAVYGIHVGYAIWDDVTVAENLRDKGVAWLKDNNKVKVKYSITALDLSLLGLVLDDFDVGNTHPIKNALLGIDDAARIIKKNIDICEEIKSTIEVGDNFKTLIDIQREQAAQTKAAAENAKMLLTTATNMKHEVDQSLSDFDKAIKETEKNLNESFTSQIEQLTDSITLQVTGSLGSKASIVLTAGKNSLTHELDLSEVRKAFANDNTAISISSGTITFTAGTIVINSSYFKVTSTGVITATSGTIGGITLCESGIYSHNSAYSSSFAGWHRPATITTSSVCFLAGATDQYGTNAKFKVTYGGEMTATDAVIYGEVITLDDPYMAKLTSGGLRLYYDDALCGTINTKYWSGAATAGISLRVEDGGNYIMFSHADDTQGSGYRVDYYLNAGWSSNYDEMHIFQTSARFLDDAYFAGYTRIRSLRLFGSDGEYLVGIGSNGQLTVSKL